MATVALHTAPDGLLAAVAPLGCASAAPTALVIDLDQGGLPLPGRRTLRDLVEEGPTGTDLRPTRTGVACLPNGGIGYLAARDVVGALQDAWPFVVLRVGEEDSIPEGAAGIAVRPLLPGARPADLLPTLYQPLGFAEDQAPPTGHRLPPLPGRVARSLLAGRRSRAAWVRAWSIVWQAR
ncbi:MAG: hypothetical protein HKN46_09970 [Acidimicrobiia bacterium]|nr:hypothetical protein [Acidimicrobiia bacterium]